MERYWNQEMECASPEVMKKLQDERLVAQVKPSNLASISCFENCGFEEEYRQYTYETDR